MDELGAAKTSVIATAAVMALYLSTWFFTGSVAAFSEFAHTLVDAIGVAATYFAIRTSRKPPDLEHPYGHYKADALGGLIGSIVVLIAAALVAFEGVEKLIKWEAYSPDLFAVFAVAGAIAIDVNRVRILKRFGHSKALSADALHFTTDIFASGGVLAVFLLGLVLERAAPAYFDLAAPAVDVAAAAAITAIFTSLSLKLLRSAAVELLDYSPPQLRDEVKALAQSVEGVVSVKDVKLRKAGSVYHGEATIEVRRGLSVEEAHEIADAVEDRLRRRLGGYVVVHVEPAPLPKPPDCCDVVLVAPDKALVYVYSRDCRACFPGYDVERIYRVK
ncbi:MAG: cation diffusion facilitator family transporter [Thermoproteus sp.]